jgi:3-dehydroquinate dehydratase / shikimate dehydrogenase
MVMIIVSITGPSMQEALVQIAGSSPHADMFEFRLDLMTKPNIARLILSTRKLTIATCRPVWEGGAFTGSERERIGILELASVFGANYVDIELGSSPRIIEEFVRRKKETKVIVSHHLLDGTLFSTNRIYEALHATGADVIKLAYNAGDGHENHLAFDFLARAKADKRNAISIAMGEAGEPSRILYKKFGGWATYASTEDGKSAAQGQIPASQLKELYRADKLSVSTKVYGVVGNPVRQSKGMFVHNPLFQRAKKNAIYCRFQVKDVEKFMKYLAPHLAGFSVTLPHKQSIMGYLDRVDDTAKSIGAINTVIRRGDRLYGTNTDAPGALDAIEKVAKVKGKRVLLLGAGGAARGIAYEAKQRGAEIVVTNRTASRGRALAKEFGLEFVSWRTIKNVAFDILVNATPIGMVPNVGGTPVPKSMLRKKIVFDAVYNPPMTRLLREAKSAGARIIQGTEMYVNQAALQSELYMGRRVSISLMRRLMNSPPSETSNIRS